MSAKTFTDKILTKGLQSSLNNTSVENGKLRFVTDAGRLYLDDSNSRKEISNVVTGMTEAQILGQLVYLPKLYMASDTLHLFASDGVEIRDVTEIDPVETIENANLNLWIDASSNNPKYSSDLTFNPHTKEFKAGNFKVNKTTSGNYDEINFYIV